MTPLEPHYLLADTSGTAEESPPAPGLLARAVAALQSRGRMIATNWDLETFDVLPVDGGEAAVGVVMSSATAVVFYGVWPQTVDQRHFAQTVELITRVNTTLYTCAFEFDRDRGVLSVRSAVALEAVDPGSDVLPQLLINALEEVESVQAEFTPTIAAVTTGRSSAAEALSTHRADGTR